MKQICKECWVEKELLDFYSHPQWKNWVMWRCKECIKKWRKSPREREMARKWEKDNRVRPDWYEYKRTKEYRIQNPLKYKAHKKVNNYFRCNKNNKPSKCSRCNTDWLIELHHEDYNFPEKVYPLCSLCHKWVHYKGYKLKKEWEIILPF